MDQEFDFLFNKLQIDQFDQLAETQWDIKNPHRSLDPKIVDEYIKRLNGKNHLFVQKVLENTKYINFNDLKNNLNKSFELFKNNIANKPYYLSANNATDYWFVLLLWKEIRKTNIMGFVSSSCKIVTGENILYITDALYNQQQINIHLDSKQKNKVTSLHIVAPYISNSLDESAISSKLLDTHLYYVEKLPTINSINLIDIYGDNYPQILQNIFHINSGDLVLAYFDHNYIDSRLVPKSIYITGIIPGRSPYGPLFSKESREIINKIEKILFEVEYH